LDWQFSTDPLQILQVLLEWELRVVLHHQVLEPIHQAGVGFWAFVAGLTGGFVAGLTGGFVAGLTGGFVAGLTGGFVAGLAGGSVTAEPGFIAFL
jgi:hypothetical protein